MSGHVHGLSMMLSSSGEMYIGLVAHVLYLSTLVMNGDFHKAFTELQFRDKYTFY